MRKLTTILFLSAILTLGSRSFAQGTTLPANMPLEYRANTAYNQGRYVAALPLLQELAGTLIDSPEKLGPVEERIRVCKKAIDAAKKMSPDAVVPVAAETAEARTAHPPLKPGDVAELAIKELGNFDFDAEKGGNIPPDVTAMSGGTIVTHGYMIPLDQAENIGEFALVPSLFACCFGQPPQVQHTIVVHLPKGKAITYFPDELQVEGKLTVQEKKDEGFIVSIFDLDAVSVKPAAK
jgi:hypothetical protein